MNFRCSVFVSCENRPTRLPYQLHFIIHRCVVPVSDVHHPIRSEDWRSQCSAQISSLSKCLHVVSNDLVANVSIKPKIFHFGVALQDGRHFTPAYTLRITFLSRHAGAAYFQIWPQIFHLHFLSFSLIITFKYIDTVISFSAPSSTCICGRDRPCRSNRPGCRC